MAKINILPTHIANMIAAGEVVERPASVVKELLENSLDAGATRIDVAARRGGRELISITDDGSGIYVDDLDAAFTPHATSKIAAVEDLEHIATMGFRGEALASIASIARVAITSRTPEADAGHRIDAEGGEISPVKPCAAPIGTTIEVRDLFYNTPARRKFLRTDSTEFSHISAAVTRVALGRLDASFSLTHNDRSAMKLPATDSRRRRIADIFGEELAAGLLEIAATGEELRVSGLIGTPAEGRSSTQMQYFFLNGRYIRDRSCMHALKEAYRGMIDPRRQPVAFIFISMAPEMFDVNVHPTKVEVRFSDSRAVHSHVLGAVRETLQRSEIRPAINTDTGEMGVAGGAGVAGEADGDEENRNPRSESLRQALADFFESQPAPQPTLNFAPGSSNPAPPATPATPATPGNRQSAGGQNQNVYSPARPEYAALRSACEAETASDTATSTEAGYNSNAQPVDANRSRAFQLHDAYIVVEEPDGIVIIDQHALHERVMYNKLLTRMAAGPLESQGLLIPATIQLTPERQEAMERCGELFEKLGIELTQFGPDSAAVQRFPSLVHRADPAEFIADLLDRCAAESDLQTEHILEAAIAMMACKAAIKAGDRISQEEVYSLLDSASQADKSTACPHGRPTQIRLTLKELEKQFHRT